MVADLSIIVDNQKELCYNLFINFSNPMEEVQLSSFKSGKFLFASIRIEEMGYREVWTMICKSCGKDMPDGEKYCSGCGAELELPKAETPADEAGAAATSESSPGQANTPVSKGAGEGETETTSVAASEDVDSAAREVEPGESGENEGAAVLQQEADEEPKAAKNCRTALKLLFLAVLVCFFFPFITVSCAGETMEASGVNLMWASISDVYDNAGYSDTDIAIDNSEERSGFDQFRLDHNLILIFAALGALGGLISAFNKDKMKELAESAGVTAVLLLVFRISFFNYYIVEEYRETIKPFVGFAWGWWAAFLFALAALVVSLIGYMKDRE